MQQEAMEAITNNNHHQHHHCRRRRRRHHYHNRHGRGCQRRASQHNKGAREECESTSEQTRQCGRYLPRRHSIKMLSRECSGLSRGVGTRREELRRGSEGGPRRMRAGELSRRRPARDIKGCCAAAPTGRDEREKERVSKREKRHPVAWWVPRYEGIRADRRGRTGRGKVRRGPGPARARTERARALGKPSKNVTLLAQLRSGAHLYSFISVDLFVGGAVPALHRWPGNRPVLTRHRDSIALRRG